MRDERSRQNISVSKWAEYLAMPIGLILAIEAGDPRVAIGDYLYVFYKLDWLDGAGNPFPEGFDFIKPKPRPNHTSHEYWPTGPERLSDP